MAQKDRNRLVAASILYFSTFSFLNHKIALSKLHFGVFWAFLVQYWVTDGWKCEELRELISLVVLLFSYYLVNIGCSKTYNFWSKYAQNTPKWSSCIADTRSWMILSKICSWRLQKLSGSVFLSHPVQLCMIGRFPRIFFRKKWKWKFFLRCTFVRWILSDSEDPALFTLTGKVALCAQELF